MKSYKWVNMWLYECVSDWGIRSVNEWIILWKSTRLSMSCERGGNERKWEKE